MLRLRPGGCSESAEDDDPCLFGVRHAGGSCALLATDETDRDEWVVAVGEAAPRAVGRPSVNQVEGLAGGRRDTLRGDEWRGAARAAGGPLESLALRMASERAALASAARWFAGREASLDSLEYYQERRLRGLGLLDEEGRSTYDDFFKDGIA